MEKNKIKEDECLYNGTRVMCKRMKRVKRQIIYSDYFRILNSRLGRDDDEYYYVYDYFHRVLQMLSDVVNCFSSVSRAQYENVVRPLGANMTTTSNIEN